MKMLLPLLLAFAAILIPASAEEDFVYTDGINRFAAHCDALTDEQFLAVDPDAVYAAAYRHFALRLPDEDAAAYATALVAEFETWRDDFIAKLKRRAKKKKAAKLAARPAYVPEPHVPWMPPARDQTVIPSGATPSTATIYGADGEIRRVFNTGTGSATIWGPEGATRIIAK